MFPLKEASGPAYVSIFTQDEAKNNKEIPRPSILNDFNFIIHFL
jgi:hypothetical protein